VDGTTAVSMMYSFLKHYHPYIGYYIPDRYQEGYGISYKGLDFAVQNGFDVLIVLDCGIKAIDEVAHANDQELDLIICDHHRPGDSVPDALAVLDPQQDSCSYPYPYLSGAGIGFKIIQALVSQWELPVSALEEQLDLAAISIGADIVPITGENRVLTHFGLKRLNSQPRPGIRAMLDMAELKRHLTVSDLVFIIGPRINAAGRMTHAENAVKLLVTEDAGQASEQAQLLNKLNSERQSLDKQITDEALEMIGDAPIMKERNTTVLFSPEWHKGVIGIVASRLVEHYYRPTIVLTESNGVLTGSARSVKDFDIYEAIEQCAHLLEQFGGHKYAAGLSLKKEYLIPFAHQFEDVVARRASEETLTPQVSIDSELSLADIDNSFFRILRQFAPFGPGNMKPVFRTNDVCDSGYSKYVGEDHLKLAIRQNGSDPKSGIAFGFGSYADKVCKNGSSHPAPFSICYTIEENEWNGQKSLQLNVKDLSVQDNE
jgi:single-stranded-DNA-specific exonuclease